MKKILLSLLISFISIGCFSQKLVTSKLKYDCDNNPYIISKIANTTHKRIACIIFTIEYAYPYIWDINRYKEVKIKKSIPAKTSKIIFYYIPKDLYRPITVCISKIIFSDGSYKEF